MEKNVICYIKKEKKEKKKVITWKLTTEFDLKHDLCPKIPFHLLAPQAAHRHRAVGAVNSITAVSLYSQCGKILDMVQI